MVNARADRGSVSERSVPTGFPPASLTLVGDGRAPATRSSVGELDPARSRHRACRRLPWWGWRWARRPPLRATPTTRPSSVWLAQSGGPRLPPAASCSRFLRLSACLPLRLSTLRTPSVLYCRIVSPPSYLHCAQERE